ncbi:hypothetical protein [Bacillus sp. 1P06AnD]|uniref:YkvI family membrane protein n=1 Tax=Bacillus sp. 1P06AnD TaxID=3132208 RepID=UPI00399F0062
MYASNVPGGIAEKRMGTIFKISSAFIGILIGAGFASGQEILQYFTSFGIKGTVGAVISVILFGYMGMTLMKLGIRTQTDSHQEAIVRISGKHLGRVIDYILVVILFGIGVVMIAGSGSIFRQQFGIPEIAGTVLMTLLVLATVMSNVDQVVKVIALVTPFLIFVVIFLFIYSMFTMDVSFSELDMLAKEQPSAAGHWLVSAINYVSLAIAMGASMTLVMGGDESNERIASIGGLVGGVGVGILVIMSHLAIFANIDQLAGLDMPSLGLANQISPVLGIVYSIVLLGMIFNSAVSMFFSLGTRFFKPKTKKFNGFVFIVLLIGFFASFFGFTQLVSFLYPLFGYLGLLLIGILVVSSFRMKSFGKSADQKKIV